MPDARYNQILHRRSFAKAGAGLDARFAAPKAIVYGQWCAKLRGGYRTICAELNSQWQRIKRGQLFFKNFDNG